MESYNLVSFLGIFGIIFIAWLSSADRKRMNWQLLGFGLGLQILFALFIFVMPVGQKFFLAINDAVLVVLNHASAGIRFVFGPLATPPGEEGSLGFILLIQGLPTIIFFSALISLLYWFGILQKIIQFFSSIFTRLFRISGAEALCASSNIFVGVESSFTIKPYLAKLTKSEIVTVLTVGMATVASNVLALYILFLKPQFSNIAGHLISASFLSAPAALIMSKIIYPEKEQPETLNTKVEVAYDKESSLFEAIMNGAQSGVKVIVSIAALLIAVLGLVSLADFAVSSCGGWLNDIFGWTVDWSFKGLLGYIFYPFTLIIGIPVEDAGTVSQIIGERLVLTEVFSYQHLAQALSDGLIKNNRSIVITTYALCGFAHMASVAIFAGGLSALIPHKKAVIAKSAFRALWAATLACLLTAAVAGTFFMNNATVLGS